MKRRTSLERTLTILRKAEEQLGKLRMQAATERARALTDLHRSFGFDSRDELIDALVALDSPRRLQRASSSKSPQARATTPQSTRATKTTGLPATVRKPATAGTAAVQQTVGHAAPDRSTARAALGPMRAPSESARSRATTALEPALPAVMLPVEVLRLLDSAVARDARWHVPEERHAIVVEILTRGDASAERWLWAQNSRDEVRSLIRRFGGAGCDDEARAVLRRKMGLSERDVPTRPFRAAIPRPTLGFSGTAS